MVLVGFGIKIPPSSLHTWLLKIPTLKLPPVAIFRWRISKDGELFTAWCGLVRIVPRETYDGRLWLQAWQFWGGNWCGVWSTDDHGKRMDAIVRDCMGYVLLGAAAAAG